MSKGEVMDIENLTLGQLREIQATVGAKTSAKHPFKNGEKYFIRTATYFHLGRLKELCGKWIILEDASWIADTGRFYDFLKDGKCNEYESFQDPVFIPIDSIIDVTPWKHDLFKGQK